MQFYLLHEYELHDIHVLFFDSNFVSPCSLLRAELLTVHMSPSEHHAPPPCERNK